MRIEVRLRQLEAELAKRGEEHEGLLEFDVTAPHGARAARKPRGGVGPSSPTWAVMASCHAYTSDLFVFWST